MSRNTPPEEDTILKWVSAFKAYIKGTDISCLDLSNLKDMPISSTTVQSILEFLPESQVTELILDKIDLSDGVKYYWKYIKRTKINKLSFRNCKLYLSGLTDLAEVLKDSNIVELNLSFCDGARHDAVSGRLLAYYLLQCRLITLRFNADHLGNAGILSLAEGLPNSNLTSLHIYSIKPDHADALSSLFFKLPHCKITDLRLDGSGLGITVDNSFIVKLSQNLAASRIEKLSLVHILIEDTGVDVLAQGLFYSNVTELKRNSSGIEGSNYFGLFLQNSKIRVIHLCTNFFTSWQIFAPNFLKSPSLEILDLNECFLNDELGSELFRSLKFSKLKTLSLYSNFLGHQSIAEFAAVLKDTSLEYVSFLDSGIPSERFELLGGCIKESGLKHISLQGPNREEATSCLHFLNEIKGSSVRNIEMPTSKFSVNDSDLFAQALKNSSFTHFCLRQSELNDIFSSLACNMKYASITHLSLGSCRIGDENVQLLARHLNETKIAALNLSGNGITNIGAEALAEYCPETSLIDLNLKCNEIENEGLEILARHFAGSLITILKLTPHSQQSINRYNYGAFLIEKVLLENRVRSHKLVASFNKFSPEGSGRNFNFHRCVIDGNVQEFLEECLEFCKITELRHPAVFSTLLCRANSPFSREEIISFFNDFPLQLVEFIRTSIEADVWQLVKFLKRAEELGLVKIVENLLLSRPSLMIDEDECIMHPYVYCLLVKYKQPICNEAVEPGGIERIKEYFIVHSDLEGAEVAVNLLSDASVNKN